MPLRGVVVSLRCGRKSLAWNLNAFHYESLNRMILGLALEWLALAHACCYDVLTFAVVVTHL